MIYRGNQYQKINKAIPPPCILQKFYCTQLSIPTCCHVSIATRPGWSDLHIQLFARPVTLYGQRSAIAIEFYSPLIRRDNQKQVRSKLKIMKINEIFCKGDNGMRGEYAMMMRFIKQKKKEMEEDKIRKEIEKKEKEKKEKDGNIQQGKEKDGKIKNKNKNIDDDDEDEDDEEKEDKKKQDKNDLIVDNHGISNPFVVLKYCEQEFKTQGLKQKEKEREKEREIQMQK
ncbi:MAG: hypothetical protein EZS28_007259, partial [Streblomastix strix]